MIKKQVAPGIIQVTMDEQRWYFDDKDQPFPSATWILDYFPKGYGYYLWLADKVSSHTEAKAIMTEAGERGSIVHWAMERYMRGETVSYLDFCGEIGRSFTPSEWELVLIGKRWCDDYEPVLESAEQSITFTDKKNMISFGGTADLIVQIDGGKFGTKKEPFPYGEGPLKCLLDWKTSQAIYDSHRAQVAAYSRAVHSAQAKNDKVEVGGIIRLGSRHKVGYEFWHAGGVTNSAPKSLGYYYDLFLAAYRFWENENSDRVPDIREMEEYIQIDGEPEIYSETNPFLDPDELETKRKPKIGMENEI